MNGGCRTPLEKWPDQTMFPRGWANEKFYMAAVSPQSFPIPGTPTGWTPGTNGLVSGEVVLVSETTQEDVQKYAGKLKGKWILTQAAPDVAAYWNAPATRMTKEELEGMELATPPPLNLAWRRLRDAEGARVARRSRGEADRAVRLVQSQRVLPHGGAAASCQPPPRPRHLRDRRQPRDGSGAVVDHGRHPGGAIQPHGADAREEPDGHD